MLFEISVLAQVSGLTALISNMIGFLLGAIVLVKAIKTKQRIIISFYLSIVFTLSPWYPSGYGYIYWLITGNSLEYIPYVLIGLVGVPIAIIAWLNVYMTTINPERKSLVLMIVGILSIIFEFYFFYNLFFAQGAPVMEMIGTFLDYNTNPIDIDYRSGVLLFLVFMISIAVITGIHFSITCMHEGSDELKWKGRFLLVAFASFGLAATFDAIVPMNVILLISIRCVLIMTTFFFYIGFILPKWVKNLLSIE